MCFENRSNFEAHDEVHKPIQSHLKSKSSKNNETICHINVSKEDPLFEVIASHPNAVNEVQNISIGADTFNKDKRPTRSNLRMRSKSLDVINKVDVFTHFPSID